MNRETGTFSSEESGTQVSNIDSFLGVLRDGGQYIQTSEFTLNSLKAREKLSQYQLPDSGLWIVKLVQTAVSSGASQFAVTFGRRRVDVVFANPLGLRAGALLQLVLSGEIPTDPTLRHMVTGLRSSATFSSESVAWSCGGESAALDSMGSRLEPVEEDGNFVLSCTRPSRQRALSKTLATSVSQLVKETAEEYEALYKRCWICPIPIIIDGKPMPRGFGIVNAGYIEESPWQVVLSYENSRRSSVSAVLAAIGVPSDSGDLTMAFRKVMGPHHPPQVTKPVHRGSTFLTWPEGPKDCKAVIVIECDLKANDYIEYVLDGAVVERVPLNVHHPKTTIFGIKITGLGTAHRVCVRVFMPVHPNELDLSQFAVRERCTKDDMASIFPTFQALTDEVMAKISDFWYIPMSPKQSKVAGASLSLPIAGGILATKGAALVPLGILGAWVVGGNTIVWRSGVMKGLKSLKSEVQRLVEEA